MPAPSGLRLLTARLAPDDLNQSRARWRRATLSLTLVALAVAVVLLTGPLLDWRNQVARAGSYALAVVLVLLATVAGRLLLRAADLKDVLGRIVVSLHPADFGTLIRALRREFGDPTSESAQTLYDRAGTPVRSREVVWRRNGVTMVATEFAGRLGQSTLSLTSDAHLQQPRR